MSDLAIFAMGTFVTILVACAVGILIWGAAQEPSAGEVPEEHKWSSTASTPARASAAESREESARPEHAA